MQDGEQSPFYSHYTIIHFNRQYRPMFIEVINTIKPLIWSISTMPVGTARNIAITPTTKLLKPNTATSLNAKVKSFSTITISISPSTNLFRLTRKVPFYNWRSSNKKAGSLVVLPPKVIKIITTTVMVD